jgi:hypothetical protein
LVLVFPFEPDQDWSTKVNLLAYVSESPVHERKELKFF